MVRRFLGCLTILILLAVVGAFLFFEYGSKALVAGATPTGHFQPPPKDDAGPDYASADAWLAQPAITDGLVQWLPQGFKAEDQVATAATFYVHPTTYLHTDRWNAPLHADAATENQLKLVAKTQASVFNGVSTVWAPRYRQAAFGAFLLRTPDADAALDLAYKDVLKAFDAFLAANPGKPIILAGHSQGSLHLSRLMVDRKDALRGRLVAAYLIGWPLSVKSDLPAMGVLPCTRPEQSGCVVSYQSFGSPANPSLILNDWQASKGFTGGPRARADMACVNPLDPVPGGQGAPEANLGALVPNASMTDASLQRGLVGAACSDGLLLVDGSTAAMGPYVLPGNNYHVFDYALFWANLRQDVARRLAQFEQKT
ncbi:DUF3089 domain-containing protein [Sphingomonas sp. ASV193]|uniref:DUF3089 domain-containing protein n=1 Tax=Sphingomonas sp. ASV193 TaxID=3144405 RepID=UPI0032E8D939